VRRSRSQLARALELAGGADRTLMLSGHRGCWRSYVWARGLPLLVVVAVVAAACGTNAEDRDRLASLKADELWNVEPPPGVIPEPLEIGEVLADTESAFGDTWTRYRQVYEIESGVDHNRLLRDYAEILLGLGWPAIVAVCGYDLYVGAGRWTDGYKRGVRIVVREARTEPDALRQTDELSVSFSAPFHSIESEPPVESVDLSCLEESAS